LKRSKNTRHETQQMAKYCLRRNGSPGLLQRSLVPTDTVITIKSLIWLASCTDEICYGYSLLLS